MDNKNTDIKWFTASPVQLRIYTANLFNSDSTSYNITTLFTLKGKMDEERLLEAIVNTVDKNSILKARFRYTDEALQYCIDNKQLQIEKKYITDELSNEELKQSALQDFVKPFDILGELLCRVRVVFTNHDIAFILLDCHHMVFDGDSVKIFAHDLQNYYESKSIEKKEDYNRFAKWQIEYKQSPDYLGKLKYWEELFSEPAQLCDFWR